MRAILPAGLCLIYLLLPIAASAQNAPADADSTKVVRVVRVASPPTIDGRLDEAVWGQANEAMEGD